MKHKDKLSKFLVVITTLLFVSQAVVLVWVNTASAEVEVDQYAGMRWTEKACAKKCGELLAKKGQEPVDNYQDFPNGCIDSSTRGNPQGVICLVPPPEVELKVPFIDPKGEEISGGVVRGISGYVAAALSWSIYVIAALAVVMLMVAGFQWIVAAGNASAIGKAKSRISNALIAIVLVLGSVVLLRTINPALVELTDIKVMMIPTVQQGTLWCRDLAVGTKLSSGSAHFEVKEIGEKDGKKIKTGGLCKTEHKIVQTGDSMAEQTCWGDECVGTEDGKRCIQEEHTKFDCKFCYIFGNITGNRELKEITFFHINKDYKKEEKEKIKPTVGGQYCITKGAALQTEGVRWYLMELLIEHARDYDDHYIIDKNGNPIAIDGKYKVAAKLEKEDIQNIVGMLFSFEDLKSLFTQLDLNINRSNFPTK